MITVQISKQEVSYLIQMAMKRLDVLQRPMPDIERASELQLLLEPDGLTPNNDKVTQ